MSLLLKYLKPSTEKQYFTTSINQWKYSIKKINKATSIKTTSKNIVIQFLILKNEWNRISQFVKDDVATNLCLSGANDFPDGIGGALNVIL